MGLLANGSPIFLADPVSSPLSHALFLSRWHLLQEAGVAICDALLDYFMPSQAQRDRAHRELLVRDRIGESNIKLPARNSIDDEDGNGGQDADVVVVGRHEEDGQISEEVNDEQEDTRDADDYVSSDVRLPSREVHFASFLHARK